MNDALTIDASVFVNAFSPTERGSEQSWRFLAQIREAEIPVFVPTLMLVEVVASLARKQNNTTLAMEWMEEIQQLSFLTFIPLDDDLARESAVIAASHRSARQRRGVCGRGATLRRRPGDAGFRAGAARRAPRPRSPACFGLTLPAAVAHRPVH
jgi:predicted nucleic acid-binding protein